jgi:glycosyltransferase involved in cell wall biosynthesis
MAEEKMTEVVIKKEKNGISINPPRLKVLMLSWEFPPNIVGGLSNHVYGLSKHLAQIVAEVHVITAGALNLPDYERINDVHIHRIKPLNEHDENFLSWIGGLNLAMAYKAIELGTKINFTVIHTHDWLVGAAATMIKNSLRIPLLTTIHATETGRNNGIHNEMQKFIHDKEKQLMKESDQIIVCSDYMQQELVSTFGIPDRKIVIIPNGIEQNKKIKDRYPNSFPDCKDKKLIFSIGRIVKEKGFETIIEAASIVKENGLNVFFVIAGKGPMLKHYQQQIQERNLEDQISFIGYITDKEKNTLMFESDINVFPSLYEPFGIVALESMAQGKPTIVSNVGGLKGIVKHKVSGLLMEAGNSDSLLEQICFLLNNPKQAQEIGEKGQRLVNKLYGWNRVASETKRLMEDLILLVRIRNIESEK